MTRFAADVVADLRQRILDGTLRPGDVLPSAKDIMSEWDCSMAVAYKAMTLMREEGLATKVVHGWGFAVTDRAAAVAGEWEPPVPQGAQTRSRLVRAGIELADADGLEAASLRLIAQRAGFVTNTIYKWVRDKAELELRMADTVFEEHPPPPSPAGGWRAQLEQACRTQWQMYRRHPWLAGTVSFADPELTPHITAHLGWGMQAAAELGLPDDDCLQVTQAAFNYVRGSAMTAARDAEQFDFGLQRLLDGFAKLG